MNGQLARSGEVVPGRVIELRYVQGNPTMARQVARGGSARGESPVVTFTTRAGEARTAVGSVNRYPAPWAVGDTVEVAYDPANPGRADLRSEVDSWLLWFGIWCGVAALPAIIAFLPVVLLVRQRRPEKRLDTIV
jgi:hypothetical protein